MSLKIAKIAVENTAYSFDKEYDYRIPEMLSESALPGCRVTVSFGRGNTRRTGLITAVCKESKSAKLKCIEAVLDEAPLLNDEMLSLVYWLRERTFCTLFDAAKALLPTGINFKHIASYTMSPDIDEAEILSLTPDEKKVFDFINAHKGYIKKERILQSLELAPTSGIPEKLANRGVIMRSVDAVRNVGDLTVKMVKLKIADGDEVNAISGLTQKQQLIIDFLLDTGTATVKEICYYTGLTSSVIQALNKKSIVEIYENPVYRKPYISKKSGEKSKSINLTSEQEEAYNNLLAQYTKGKGGVSLLFGVTGSGKTLVYLKLIDKIISKGKNVIVMVPEIALTPQTLAIFNQRYGSDIAVFHSALSLGERADEWRRVKKGEVSIVIGTRSAVFAPLENIGLIIIDEEQEKTYKSDQSPRYNAKDVARFRCAEHNALLILSSATPSVESYAAAKEGRYSLNVLNNRYGTAILPEVVTVDMREELAQGNNSEISSALLKALEENLVSDKQSIIMINRRGYNTYAVCRSCSAVITCPSCSISMRYHNANKRLMCHYCGFSQPFTDTCASCGKKDVRYSGFGTQKIEDEIGVLLPQARILRMDTDTTMSRLSHERKFEQFANREFDILLGTQMVAKGLDFENVTLAGVVSIDHQLYNDDYSSMESAFGLLTQVVGRSGRGKYKGKAIIQTFTPENEIIRLAAKQDYDTFFQTEIQIRKLLIYPPFCDICLYCFAGENEMKVKSASLFVFERLKEKTAENYSDLKLIVLGPVAARVAKVNNRYRYRIIIKCHNSSRFRQLIRELIAIYDKQSSFSKVTAYIDMNPDSVI
ncbi:MAG: primosomal protein N' [Clostridiales bacterium]|nr:primosomal protein N' [Clostridiales bacterium]